ncbi:hypothetical protein [Paenibacillus thiaminolyticus]|nr:hypothetical protein [Paenibacillus thiaminolyticus]
MMKKISAVLALTAALSAFSATAAWAAESEEQVVPGAVGKTTKQIDLDESVPFYTFPGGKRMGALGPQVVKIEESVVDQDNRTWHRALTWIGYGYFKDPSASYKTIVLPDKTAFYDKVNGERLGLLGRQTVNVINEQVDDSGFVWYQLHTYKGKAWVISPSQEKQKAKLTKETALYDQVNGRKAGALSPQTVNVSEVRYDGNNQRWGKVFTWKGDLWIKW